MRELLSTWQEWLSGAVRGRSRRVSILLPFVIISAGLGVLAWRSYHLSVRMEKGANRLAEQYAGYAAEVTARRVDAAAAAELNRAADQWQLIERQIPEPTFAALRNWINSYEWIVSAIYVPDFDPTNSIFVSELTGKPRERRDRLTREFYTSSGTMRYTYDPERLLRRVQSTIRHQPLVRDDELQYRADLDIVPARGPRIVRDQGAFAVASPLAPPLSNYAVRASVRTSYVGSGWENQRVISLWASLIALVLTSLGAYLAFRGLKRESETMKLRGALIANVSHELRTPLAMIRLGAETLKRGAKLKEKERLEIEDQILREVLHLSHLVENVLDVARMQHQAAKALAFTPVFPRELVTSLVATYESWIRSKGFSVTVTIDDSVEEQLWDREAVSRALLNLIDNAIKYSGDEKAIEIALRQTATDVIVEVTDHGLGIETKEIPRIFDPYYRAQFSDTQTRRGAGLGLTLVQQIVASHGGRVEVESVVGKGSTFRLIFPRGSAGAAERVPRLVEAPEAF